MGDFRYLNDEMVKSDRKEDYVLVIIVSLNLSNLRPHYLIIV